MTELNPFELAQAQFDQAAEQMGLDQGVRAILRHPLREYHFSIPKIRSLAFLPFLFNFL